MAVRELGLPRKTPGLSFRMPLATKEQALRFHTDCFARGIWVGLYFDCPKEQWVVAVYKWPQNAPIPKGAA